MLQPRYRTGISTLLLLTTICASYEVYPGAVEPTANTTIGSLKGRVLNVYGQKVHAFLGVPYARPPVGDRRFAKPLPLSHSKIARLATSYGSSCPQEPPDDFDTLCHPAMREDCLTLNIWIPPRASQPVANKSVMVWLHGGGFKKGHSGEDFYDGAVLSATQDVVVVTLNYRLGYLGFMNALHPSASGNAGLYDQLLALTWIQDNIRAFGGNPSSVTLFGKGAGATAVALLLLSPQHINLFHRVILQSADLDLSKYVEDVKTAADKADALAAELGCSRRGHSVLTAPEAVLECVKSRDASELLRAQADLRHRSGPALPTFGTDFLPQEPTLLLDRHGTAAVDILMGHNREKGKEVLSSLFPSLFGPVIERNMTVQDAEIVFHVLANTYGYPRTVAEELLEFYLKNANTSVPQDLSDAAVRFATDLVTCASVSLAQRFTSAGRHVFYYQTAYSSESRLKLGVSVDTFMSSFAFGMPERYRGKFNDVDRSLSHVTMYIFAHFAKQGRPPLLNGMAWTKFMMTEPNYFELDPYVMRTRTMDTSGCDLLAKFRL